MQLIHTIVLRICLCASMIGDVGDKAENPNLQYLAIVRFLAHCSTEQEYHDPDLWLLVIYKSYRNNILHCICAINDINVAFSSSRASSE